MFRNCTSEKCHLELYVAVIIMHFHLRNFFIQFFLSDSCEQLAVILYLYNEDHIKYTILIISFNLNKILCFSNCVINIFLFPIKHISFAEKNEEKTLNILIIII